MPSNAEARIVRRAELRESTWRNGGGVAYEIARSPHAGEPFDWRLSMARIDRDGPFSDYVGYERALSIISGDGCRLLGAASAPKELRGRGATALFSGDRAVRCELLGGACMDLNLIVRRPGRILAVEHFSLPAHETESLAPDCAGSVFCVEGALDCLHLASGQRVTLNAHDTLLVDADDAASWRLLRASDDLRVIVHAWRSA